MPITNVAELFRCESTTAVLRLCGAKEEDLGADSADYTYFCALCRAIPLLVGHPLSNRFFRLFASMKITVLPDAIDPESLWVEGALYLSMHDESDLLYDDITNNASDHIRFTPIEIARYSMVDTSDWLNTDAENWQDWERNLYARWEESCSCADLILFCLSIESLPPSVYHVNAALSSHENAPILSAQLLRYLCDACKKHRKTLLIKVGSVDAKNLLIQLQHLKKTLGLPSLILSFANEEDLDILLPFASQPQDASVVLGMEYEHDLSFSNIAALYPIGRLFLYEEHLDKIKVYSVIKQ